jgi:hypothetical protein
MSALEVLLGGGIGVVGTLLAQREARHGARERMAYDRTMVERAELLELYVDVSAFVERLISVSQDSSTPGLFPPTPEPEPDEQVRLLGRVRLRADEEVSRWFWELLGSYGRLQASVRTHAASGPPLDASERAQLEHDQALLRLDIADIGRAMQWTLRRRLSEPPVPEPPSLLRRVFWPP